MIELTPIKHPRQPFLNSRVECGPGWYAIIDPLIRICNALDIPITQIKEKFAGLRFYTEIADDTPDAVCDILNGAIAAAETRARRTCEECGLYSTTDVTVYARHGRGWLRTLCLDHGREWEAPATGEPT